jgi:hypothetical protein
MKVRFPGEHESALGFTPELTLPRDTDDHHITIPAMTTAFPVHE